MFPVGAAQVYAEGRVESISKALDFSSFVYYLFIYTYTVCQICFLKMTEQGFTEGFFLLKEFFFSTVTTCIFSVRDYCKVSDNAIDCLLSVHSCPGGVKAMKSVTLSGGFS